MPQNGRAPPLQQPVSQTHCLCWCTGTGRLQQSWIDRADAVFAQCLGHPGVMAFMMDQWAELLEQPTGPAAADCTNAPGRMPLPMLEWLYEKTNVSAAARPFLGCVQLTCHKGAGSILGLEARRGNCVTSTASLHPRSFPQSMHLLNGCACPVVCILCLCMLLYTAAGPHEQCISG